MDNIGAEVSQKMRSAIKAKLMELDCYVDDELPDYIMVMVANKRTKSQMNEDLQLFLTNKTSTFVDWLHIVLKKLKEVHVTNPDVYAKSTKRKGEDLNINVKVKKEKKDKKMIKKQKDNNTEQLKKSLTDDLPITANKLSEVRKIIVMQSNDNNHVNNLINDDGFDIPLLSEVNLSNEKELEILEKRIKSVKTRLGIQVDTESEDEDFLNIKAEPDELFPSEKQQNKRQRKVAVQSVAREPDSQNQRKVTIDTLQKEVVAEEEEANNDDSFNSNNIIVTAKGFKHARITFESNEPPKKSVMERLGKRRLSMENSFEPKKQNLTIDHDKKSSPINKLEMRRSKNNFTGKSRTDKDRILQFEKPRESVLSRLGIMSKVAIPDKPKEVQPIEEEDEKEEPVNKEVASVVKVKPRILLPNAKQANKTLLLKAVADAQRSIAQTPNVGNNIDKANFFLKKSEEKSEKHNVCAKRKLLDTEKKKLKNIIVHIARDELKNDENQEYVPQPLRKTVVNTNVTYVPTSKSKSIESDSSPVLNQKFIVTLDGVDKEKFIKKAEEVTTKKPPSPIIFDKTETEANKSKVNVPDVLPMISTLPLKNKERCKYWPLCKQGEKCEFIHPTIPCKMFPTCKFGDKCVYIHPTCKFESSCTRRDCPYSHTTNNKVVASRIVPPATVINVAKQTLQTCKFFPNCINIHCTFYHPKPCKFGKYCKNQSECNFSHTYASKATNLIWRSNKV